MIRIVSQGVALLLCSLMTMGAPPATNEVPADLTLDTLSAWRDVVEPSETECVYLDIDWETTVGDGVRRAWKERKPLLIYVMNGHPLGCT